MKSGEEGRDRRSEWLDGLKAGDLVAVYLGDHYDRLPSLRVVKRVTDSQIVVPYCGAERRYWRKNGSRVGRSNRGWCGREYIDPVTPELLAKVRYANAVGCLRGAKWETFDRKVVEELARRVEAEQQRVEDEEHDGPGKSGDAGEE